MTENAGGGFRFNRHFGLWPPLWLLLGNWDFFAGNVANANQDRRLTMYKIEFDGVVE